MRWGVAIFWTILGFAIWMGRFESKGIEVFSNLETEWRRDWKVGEGSDTSHVSRNGVELIARTMRGARIVWAPVPIERRWRFLLVEADLGSEGVVPSAAAWSGARVILVGYDARGEALYHYPHGLALLRGTRAMRHYEAVFELNEEMKSVGLVAQVAAASGKLMLNGLSVQVMSERWWFRAGFLIWSGGVILLIGWLVRSYGVSFFRSLCFGVVFLVGGLVLVIPGINRALRPVVMDRFWVGDRLVSERVISETREKDFLPKEVVTSDRVEKEVNGNDEELRRWSVWSVVYPHRGHYHLIVFGGLAFVCCLVAGRQGVFWWPLGIGLASELVVLGHGMPMRVTDWVDLVWNVVGVGLGVLAYGVWVRCWRLNWVAFSRRGIG